VQTNLCLEAGYSAAFTGFVWQIDSDTRCVGQRLP